MGCILLTSQVKVKVFSQKRNSRASSLMNATGGLEPLRHQADEKRQSEAFMQINPGSCRAR
jgi:hypothetical protein